ncbi:MAG: PAS domain-containing sensor histidine kinase [Melioribacteraceae bacterium]|nr:PAS domain-containing sensor histidine kinase [Melioribacteraceae bacterium]
MSDSPNDILQQIKSLTQSDSGYIFKTDGEFVTILSYVDEIDIHSKAILEISKMISLKNASLNEIYKSGYFVELNKEKNYVSIFREKILENEEIYYHIVLFWKKKPQDVKLIRSKLTSSLNKLKKKLSEFHQNKSIEPEQLFNEALATIQSVIFSTNADGSEYYFITDAVRNLFGYSPQEIYDNKLLILRSIDEDHFHKFRGFIDKLKTGDVSFVEYRMKDRFGKEHWVRHSGIPIIRDGNVVRVVGTINEITEEKTTQLKLISSEEKFRMLIDTAEDLIFILNGFGYFNLVNINGATALGYMPDEMIGKHFLEFIDKEDESKIAEAFSKILSSNEITTFEAVFLDRFDKPVTFEINAKPMMSDGEVSGMISIGRNVTTRKLHEQKIRDLNSKLVEANRIISIERERARHKINVLEELNKLKSEFISNISHELRTPLASIVGFAETILSDPDLPKETAREFNEIILSEGKRLAKLINDVLDFSKLESGEEELKQESFNVLDVLSEVLDLFTKPLADKEIYLSTDLPGGEINIVADRARIYQVFFNLMSNAIKFTNRGGRIFLILVDHGKEIEFTITDTGIGIPEKDIPKLFQKFSKIQRPGAPLIGAGFGLVTVKQIVELHKGVVRVKSEEDKGSTFIVRLPKQ